MNQFVSSPEAVDRQVQGARAIEDEQSGGITLSDIFRVLAKGKWLILFCALACTIAAAIYAKLN